jgi:flavin reductase (DIM6/NTAB) family NADH-FMN oxidoreductase RutF
MRSDGAGVTQTVSGCGDRRLRTALGAYPTGVTVVTCLSTDGRPVGITANSFVSLSLQPALVSIALHKAGRYVAAFVESGAFTVNVLRADQQGLSNHFARPSACSWESIEHRISESGHLILADVAAYFECRLVRQHDAGDHVLLIGEILQYDSDEDARSLVFMRGRYGIYSPGDSGPPLVAGEWPMCDMPIGWA